MVPLREMHESRTLEVIKEVIVDFFPGGPTRILLVGLQGCEAFTVLRTCNLGHIVTENIAGIQCQRVNFGDVTIYAAEVPTIQSLTNEFSARFEGFDALLFIINAQSAADGPPTIDEFQNAIVGLLNRMGGATVILAVLLCKWNAPAAITRQRVMESFPNGFFIEDRQSDVYRKIIRITEWNRQGLARPFNFIGDALSRRREEGYNTAEDQRRARLRADAKNERVAHRLRWEEKRKRIENLLRRDVDVLPEYQSEESDSDNETQEEDRHISHNIKYYRDMALSEDELEDRIPDFGDDDEVEVPDLSPPLSLTDPPSD